MFCVLVARSIYHILFLSLNLFINNIILVLGYTACNSGWYKEKNKWIKFDRVTAAFSFTQEYQLS